MIWKGENIFPIGQDGFAKGSFHLTLRLLSNANKVGYSKVLNVVQSNLDNKICKSSTRIVERTTIVNNRKREISVFKDGVKE